ncbi:SUR7/PalI family-domain-containing protein [Coniella lustricola]|uniref:SUR7/PalI family-domain-containing protein n=1 Tax=Coniella lustricola TaxID=2025994 RepID=A0A2T3A9Y5_9PEZI|nr:SUR7/PalI family-domain-containing protein [Coniella lustricola]
MSFGRIVCVFVPFALTIASIITLLVACLAGITSKDVYSFKVNTTDFSMSVSDISSLLSRSEPLPLYERDTASSIESAASSLESSTGTATTDLKNDFSDLIKTASAALASATSASDAVSAVTSAVGSQNITAADLGLADAYYVSLWNYCEHSNNGTTTCSKSKFDWVSNATSAFESKFEAVVEAAGANATLPSALKDGMKTFATVTKWTEICFIISFIFLGATMIFGIFANCTRFFSICATLVAVVAALAVIASASLATGSAAVVVGLAEGSAKEYGVTASFNKHFLVNVWLAALFIIAAVLFWTFSICCCAPDHHKRSRRGAGNKYAEDAMPVTQVGAATGGRGYQRLADPEVPAMSSAYAGAGYGQGETGYHYNNNTVPGSSYEPYKHTAA